MKIYWTLGSIPELAHLPRKERGRRWRQVSSKGFRHWQVWLALLGCGLCAGLGAHFGMILWPLFSDSPTLASMLGGSIGGGIGGGIGGFLMSQVHITTIRKHYLSDKNISDAFQ